MNKKASFPVASCILLVLSLALTLGTAFVFKPCGPRPDGTWMNCHQAGTIVTALGIVLSVLSAVRICIPSAGAQMAFDVSSALIAILSAVVPGPLVHLCMMREMRCHSVTRPAVIVIASLIALCSVCDLVLHLIKVKKSKTEAA